MGPHPSVFMSFAWDDRELADQVTKSLNDAGLTVNRPDTELRAGDRWAEAVKSALTDSDLMVFIVPPEGAAGSNNVFFEAGVAEGLKKPVVAVVKNPSDIQNIRSVPFVSAQDMSGLIRQVHATLNETSVIEN